MQTRHLPVQTDSFEVIGVEYRDSASKRSFISKKSGTIIKHSGEIDPPETDKTDYSTILTDFSLSQVRNGVVGRR